MGCPGRGAIGVGALYTGRGPVCGTIMRGPGGACGCRAGGAAWLVEAADRGAVLCGSAGGAPACATGAAGACGAAGGGVTFAGGTLVVAGGAEIGRASCRERVESGVGDGAGERKRR